MKLFRSQILVDICDQHIVDRYSWRFNKGYAVTTIEGKTVPLHRLIYPEYKFVDHKNNVRLDNRRSNLRECTVAQNNQNSRVRINSKSGYKGVSFTAKNKKKPWAVYINHNSFGHYVGNYKTKEEAALAYNEAAIKYHGEFANLNVIM